MNKDINLEAEVAALNAEAIADGALLRNHPALHVIQDILFRIERRDIWRKVLMQELRDREDEALERLKRILNS